MKGFEDMKRVFALFMTMLIVLTSAICIEPDESYAANKINLNKTQVTSYVGRTVKLKMEGTTANVRWSSSDKTIATVSSKGVVTLKKKGKATIKARVKGKTYKCYLTVKRVAMNRSKAEIKTGDTLQLKVKGARGTVYWSSSDKAIAKVSSKGLVTAKSAGTVIIKAKNNKSTYKCTVSVIEATGDEEETSGADITGETVIDYNDNVIVDELKKETKYTVHELAEDKAEVVFNKDAVIESLETGDIIKLPGNDSTGGFAMKITDITVDESGKYVITGETPEAEEVFDELAINELVEANLENMIPNEEFVESVEMITDELTNVNDEVETYDTEESDLQMSATTTVEKHSNYYKITVKDKKGEGSVSGSISIYKPTFDANLKVTWNNAVPTIKSFDISFQETAKATIKCSMKEKEKRYKLGTLASIPLGNDFYVDVDLYVIISADGSVSFECKETLDAGIVYSNKTLKPKAKITMTKNINIEASGKVIPALVADISFGTFLDIDIVGMEVGFGPAGKVGFNAYGCSDFTTYFYSYIAISQDSGIGKVLKSLGLKFKYVMMDDNDKNKLRWKLHLEGGKRVDKCTKGNTVITPKPDQTAIDAAIARAKAAASAARTATLASGGSEAEAMAAYNETYKRTYEYEMSKL